MRVPDKLKPLLPELALAAQGVYDAWEVEEGCGGICDDVASAMVYVLDGAGIEANTVHYESDNHTAVVYVLENGKDRGVWSLDIPYSTYEIQHGFYNYEKIDDVRIEASDVVTERLDKDPEKFNEYIEY